MSTKGGPVFTFSLSGGAACTPPISSATGDVMYCDISITIMSSLNLFINGFPLLCPQVKHQSCQDIKL